MLKVVDAYEKVFVRYLEEDTYYAIVLYVSKGGGYPYENDWINARKMADYVGHFYDLTLRISSYLHVTLDSFFENYKVHFFI